MFYILSKLLWPLLQPLYHLAGAICLCALFSAMKWRKAAMCFSFYAAFILLLFGFMPVGYNALVYLESQYKRPVLGAEFVPHGVLVLGGAFEENLSAHYGQAMAGNGLERMTTFVGMINRYHDMPTKLVFSGGSAGIARDKEDNTSGESFTDADAAALFLLEQGVNTGRVTFEARSRTSYENIAFSYDLLRPHHSEDWLVITSAYHMPRVMNVMAKYNWPATAYPVDYQTLGTYKFRPDLDILKNFYYTQLAIHEFAGNAVYYLTDKAASFLP